MPTTTVAPASCQPPPQKSPSPNPIPLFFLCSCFHHSNLRALHPRQTPLDAHNNRGAGILPAAPQKEPLSFLPPCLPHSPISNPKSLIPLSSSSFPDFTPPLIPAFAPSAPSWFPHSSPPSLSPAYPAPPPTTAMTASNPKCSPSRKPPAPNTAPKAPNSSKSKASAFNSNPAVPPPPAHQRGRRFFQCDLIKYARNTITAPKANPSKLNPPPRSTCGKKTSPFNVR